MFISSNLPTGQQLYEGAILHTIVHGVWTITRPLLSHFITWVENNYNFRNDQGSQGSITFEENTVVGVLFSLHSLRNPYRTQVMVDWQDYFGDAARKFTDLARQEATQFMIQEYEGGDYPLITTAFWGEYDRLMSNDTWDEILLHSGNLLYGESLHPTIALASYYKQSYDLTQAQINLIKVVFDRWRKNANPQIIVSRTERATLAEHQDGKGLPQAKRLLSSIGVILED